MHEHFEIIYKNEEKECSIIGIIGIDVFLEDVNLQYLVTYSSILIISIIDLRFTSPNKIPSKYSLNIFHQVDSRNTFWRCTSQLSQLSNILSLHFPIISKSECESECSASQMTSNKPHLRRTCACVRGKVSRGGWSVLWNKSISCLPLLRYKWEEGPLPIWKGKERSKEKGWKGWRGEFKLR